MGSWDPTRLVLVVPVSRRTLRLVLFSGENRALFLLGDEWGAGVFVTEDVLLENSRFVVGAGSLQP